MLTLTLFDTSFIAGLSTIISSASPAPAPGPDPTVLAPGLSVWFKAESLSSSLSEGGLITTGSNSWFDYLNPVRSASRHVANSEPYYTTTKFANSMPAVHFSAAGTYDRMLMSPLLTLESTSCSISILFKGKGTDSMMLGHLSTNNQIRYFRAGVKGISAYDEAQNHDQSSNTFSCSISQSVVFSWVFSGSTAVATFYEGKYNRGTTPLGYGDMGINMIGDTSYGATCTGSIAEILIWNGTALSQSQITSLYDNYWKVKYNQEVLI